MKERFPSKGELVDEEEERNPESLEHNFTIALESALVVFDDPLEDEDENDLASEIMQKVEHLDGIKFTEDGDARIYTKFGDPGFWEEKIPEIKRVIVNFLEDKKEQEKE